MTHTFGRIGIDLGSVYVKAVRLNTNGQVVETFYRRHRGEVKNTFDAALHAMHFRSGDSLGISGAAASQVYNITTAPIVDQVRAQIAAVTEAHPEVVEILDIGGASCTLIQLDSKGQFQGFSTNSLCAAGTGSFLDEQATRLGLSYDDAQEFEHVTNPPSIAARCSVFAKSDLIHRQQEGYSKKEMWSGLCRGMTRTLLGTLLSGRPLAGKTAIIGGVALNKSVLSWLSERLGDLIIIPEQPHIIAARGAALLGEKAERKQNVKDDDTTQHATSSYSWPLTMAKSDYPSFACLDNYVDEYNNEIRILIKPRQSTLPVYFGFDIGSTSTKAVVTDEDDQVIVDIYRKTAGDPINATKLLCKALRDIASKLGVTWDIRAVGTTGSGRALVGAVIGADAVINEISAHVAGAVRVDPTVDTIFEIGGQDSKYMHIVDGHIRDANMNYVCAAGTGSFVEEQAQKLGYKVSEVGQAVLGSKPPRASDRCTVFMEQDVVTLMQNGASRERALSAVMVAIVKNYLNKVVGNRHISREKIFFQGATARNPALVAAFERVLNVKMVVSPYCHVMGSYGVALLTRQLMSEQNKNSSSFRGLNLDQRQISLRKETCTLCQNNCTITYADIEGVEQSPSWGYMCGRDPYENRVRVSPHARYLRLRRRLWLEGGSGVTVADNASVVGIPRSLSTYTFAPMWRRFFNELGFKVELSPETNQEIRELGSRIAGAEFCHPAKVALGHVAWLATRQGVDFVFVPHLDNESRNINVNAATYCPYVQALPAYSRSALALNSINTAHLLSPLIDKRMPEAKLVRQLAQTLAAPLGRTKQQIKSAWQLANTTQKEFEQRCYAEGDKALREARERNERLIVLVGRPYNTADYGINLDLPNKIAEHGLTVLPMDFIRPNYSLLGERYRNVYWAYGQKILVVLEQVARDDLLDVIYLTNFSCGPDSFLLTYAEEIMGNQPFLALELDEHGGDAGYLTRIEAFLDVLKRPRRQEVQRRSYQTQTIDFKQRTLWIPPMHEFGAEFFAAAFRQHGYNARQIPFETAATFELGRSLTRGSECLPTALTIGAFIANLREQGLTKGQALMMPTACGPCRFGQYCQLHRQILDREGLEDVAILSPSSLNAYQGVDDTVRRTLFKAIVMSDILQKARCKVRPYENEPGATNRVVAYEKEFLIKAINDGADLRQALKASIDRIAAIPHTPTNKPLVGIVGEIYVRNNMFSNENLIDTIECLGGEAWPTPIIEWMLFLASPQNFLPYMQSAFNLKALKSYITYRWQLYWERALYKAAGPFLADRHEPNINATLNEAKPYMERNIGGEGMSIIGRTIKFARDGAALVVNCAPFSCMPGVITTAISRHVSALHDMPIVNMFYDGQGNQNKRLAVFLNNAMNRQKNDSSNKASKTTKASKLEAA
ncbi:MAG: hypothetical protein JW841_08220 [Deltaproteobacteria bacterium]|nr:hypothetical protein [Deltaproteobacteria bacterium]